MIHPLGNICHIDVWVQESTNSFYPCKTNLCSGELPIYLLTCNSSCMCTYEKNTHTNYKHKMCGAFFFFFSFATVQNKSLINIYSLNTDNTPPQPSNRIGIYLLKQKAVACSGEEIRFLIPSKCYSIYLPSRYNWNKKKVQASQLSVQIFLKGPERKQPKYKIYCFGRDAKNNSTNFTVHFPNHKHQMTIKAQLRKYYYTAYLTSL